MNPNKKSLHQASGSGLEPGTYTGCPPKKVERSIFVTLKFENIAYFDFIK